jgi:hypothetical protein
MDDFVVNVKQIGNYPAATTAGAADLLLLQQGGLGGPYASIDPVTLVGLALSKEGVLQLSATAQIKFNGAALSYTGTDFSFSAGLLAPSGTVSGAFDAGTLTQNGSPVALEADLLTQIDLVVQNTVLSFNGRTGAVLLETDDVLRAGAAPIWNPHFGGTVTAPTPWNARGASDQVATTAFVQAAICANINDLLAVRIVTSFDGRFGDVTLTGDDITLACTPLDATPQTNTPPFGDSSLRIANTMFVEQQILDVQAWANANFVQLQNQISADLSLYAPLASPAFTGVPTAPTAAAGTSTAQLATTSFVHAAVVAATTGVSSFNTRTGAVTLTTTDITAAGGAPVANPSLTGIPQAPTATAGTSTQQIATTAFVENAVAASTAGVASFNTRTGNVTLSWADVSGVGAAPLASPAFTGVPTAATATPGTNTTQLATTAFVETALAAAPGGVTSFNSRTGAITLQANDVSAVGGALLVSPNFTGGPTAPTVTPASTSNTLIATTAFVQSAIAATALGVQTFNTRAGNVVFNASDLASVNGAFFTQADNPPTLAPGPGQTFWFDSLHGQLYTRYVDPVSQALSWIIANSPPQPVTPPPPPPPRNYIAGLTLSTVGTTTFTISPGLAVDSTNQVGIGLATALTKSSSAFGPGGAAGALDQGTIAGGTWYHAYLIYNPTTQATDGLISLSATAPNLPGGFTRYRRIGAMWSNSPSAWGLFSQNGDEFLFGTPFNVANQAAISTTPTLLTMAVPTGIQVWSKMRGAYSSPTADNYALLSSPDEASTAVNTPVGNVTMLNTVAGVPNYWGEMAVRTSTSGQIRAVANAAGNLMITCFGYIDRRGRDA